MIEPAHPTLSIQRQCTLMGLSRGAYYYHPVAESEDNLRLMRLLDEQYLQTPFYGSRRMIVWLQHQGHQVNRKRVQRLMRQMGLERSLTPPDGYLPFSRCPFQLDHFKKVFSLFRHTRARSCSIEWAELLPDWRMPNEDEEKPQANYRDNPLPMKRVFQVLDRSLN